MWGSHQLLSITYFPYMFWGWGNKHRMCLLFHGAHCNMESSWEYLWPASISPPVGTLFLAYLRISISLGPEYDNLQKTLYLFFWSLNSHCHKVVSNSICKACGGDGGQGDRGGFPVYSFEHKHTWGQERQQRGTRVLLTQHLSYQHSQPCAFTSPAKGSDISGELLLPALKKVSASPMQVLWAFMRTGGQGERWTGLEQEEEEGKNIGRGAIFRIKNWEEERTGQVET